MKTISLLVASLIFTLTSITAQTGNYTAATTDVQFELQRVKPIGNELRFYFMITNMGETDAEITLRANDHKAWDDKGNAYDSYKEVFSNSVRTSSSFEKRTLIPGVGIKVCIIFNENNISELNRVKMLQLESNLGIVRISDIPVPSNTEPKPDMPNLIEVEDRVFMSIQNISREGEALRLNFLTVNKTEKDIEAVLRGTGHRIIDAQGNEYQSKIIELASVQRSGSSFQKTNLVQDVPVNGFIEFPGAANTEKIMLFELSMFGNTYRLKDLEVN
jgi:hypothetical protein